MAHMYDNGECTSRNFGDSSQYTNYILYLAATCHMTPEVSDFISGLLDETDKHIEGADGHHVIKKGKYKLKCATITEILLSQHCTTYFGHHIYATAYFQLLR